MLTNRAAADVCYSQTVRKATSFVTPTHGSPHSLTLSTYVTDAADLHYVVVLSGHAPLDAKAIKNAAQQCKAEESSSSEGSTSLSQAVDKQSARDRHSSSLIRSKSDQLQLPETAFVAASTVIAAKAQKIERHVGGLQSNTSYDVYFVAEVSGSNGVFGAVQSVLHSSTHPEPPAITITSIRPANDSATTVEVNATLSTPGRVYFACIPSSPEQQSTRLTAADIVHNRSVSEAPSAFALYDQDAWSELAFQQVVGGLISATLYDILVVTEALGDGGVRSDIIRQAEAVRTHFLPPDVSQLTASPRDGSADALVVDFQLHFDAQDLRRVTPENLQFFNYKMRYEAARLLLNSDAASFTKSSEQVDSNAGGSAASPHHEPTDVVRGAFNFGNFSSMEHFQEQLAMLKQGVIPGLHNGTLYRVTLVAETATSYGLLGREQSAAPSRTHEKPPRILSAAGSAVNGSVTALSITAEMERGANIHYLAVERSSGSIPRHYLHEAKSMEHFVSLVRGDRDDVEIFSGVVELDPLLFHSPLENTSESTTTTHTAAFQIEGLRDATAYTIALMPETRFSNGVFGQPFEQFLESQTNENASDVRLVAAEPVFGSTSGIELAVEMTKRNDVLYYCLVSASGDSNGEEEASLPRQPSKGDCHEADRESFQLSRGAFNGLTFLIQNLTEDTAYQVSLFAENVHRNQVFSATTSPPLSVKTHKRAPPIRSGQALPVAAATDRTSTSLAVEENCLVHYAIHEAPRDVAAVVSSSDTTKSEEDGTPLLLSPEAIIQEKALVSPNTHRRIPFVSQGDLFAEQNALATFPTANLKANTTYLIHLVTETSVAGNSSGVYGVVSTINVTTFATAPKIVKATVDPTPDRTDSVFVMANLSVPGIVHYFLSDVDFADPAVIRSRRSASRHVEVGESSSADEEIAPPHTVRGEFYVYEHDLAMEIINGTNDSKPVEPRMYVSNTTVHGLKSGATYHVSLTTETFASGGVFGDFPPPILVTTHLPAPTIMPSVLSVRPKSGSSDTLAVELELSRFGEVHYAVFFRGLVPDRSDAVLEQRRLEAEEKKNREVATQQGMGASALSPSAAPETNASEAAHVWPPISSKYDLAQLNASLLKAARLDDLGDGVWENGTITVAREDVLKGKRAVKEIAKLPPNAIFDVCLVSETAASDGIFDWESSATACHRMQTHADYSNQSILFDEIAVEPVDGETGSVRIELSISKLLHAPASTDLISAESAVEDRFAIAAGRTPYYILADGKEARKEFASNSFANSPHDRERSGFKDAVQGSNHVASAGMLSNITRENDTFLVVTQEIHHLKPDHRYFLFFAYETSGSDGVFTQVNPHKHRSDDPKAEHDAIEVVTHETAPTLTKYATTPTFGNTSRLTIKFDIVCASCKEAIVHALVYDGGCTAPSSVDVLKTGNTKSPRDLARVDTKEEQDVLLSVDEDSASDEKRCREPLVRRRFVVEMNDRERKTSNVERDLFAANDVLKPNTTYKVLLATETAGSNGVLSDTFIETVVTTFAPAPRFKHIQVSPRNGSTTELMLEFELERPGEVHYMCGVSGNPELNVTSAYNVSRKRRPEEDAPNFHDYPREVVRLHHSVKVERAGEKHTELLEHLSAGTTYDVYVVAEAAGSNGVYGEVLHYAQVSTHANPPILLAHSAHPTPGSTTSLTVGFRVDAPGTVHFSVVKVDHWSPARHVASGSDFYGNRLAMHEQLVAQESLLIDEKSMGVTAAEAGSRDSGWREVNISVPHSGTNYTVYLVTETTASDGVFGTVASHRDVHSHGEPPSMLKISVTPADARVDALAAHLQLSDAGHIHYVVLPHHRKLSERDDAAVVQGMVIVNSADNNGEESFDDSRSGGGEESGFSARRDSSALFDAKFVIDELKEGTVYDLYFRCETLHSFGVFGSWTHFPISARTHGLPPDVLEEVECAVNPSCEAIGREAVRNGDP